MPQQTETSRISFRSGSFEYCQDFDLREKIDRKKRGKLNVFDAGTWNDFWICREQICARPIRRNSGSLMSLFLSAGELPATSEGQFFYVKYLLEGHRMSNMWYCGVRLVACIPICLRKRERKVRRMGSHSRRR